ncbi:2,4-dihydroxyhept-2-ene-1,7-dioic acid aldolase [Fulvimarina endophytica]|uniref:2,4-dihydroxyhept-2-ene-1,7-dioic acid aldolase n=1 Tax=Fulvimarina endophytica TaxID=2293836 RepID=A0A371X7G0_9HYPH|nr:aldolase/citrate lyase family protein [Fulvimarina endophytica]RFC65148.1 2,4-dihydroxyhept-2-ene-1,7-dioic acid aldolase [Fulvimarina endophytica]
MTAGRKPLKGIFETGETAMSAWLGSPDPFTQEAFFRADFDIVTLDMQHGLIDQSDVRDAITRAHGFGRQVVVRVPVDAFALASWVLDMGAGGIIAPMIETADEARAFVRHAKYPPLGLRSFGPIRAALLSADGDAGAYVAKANTETFAFAMIETRRALDAIDEIAGIEGLDGLFVGPSDLSIALSDDGRADLEGARLKTAMADIVAACSRHGKIAACYATNPGQARLYSGFGFSYVCVGSDLKVIADGTAQLASDLRG